MKRSGFQQKPRKPLKRTPLRTKTPLRAKKSPQKKRKAKKRDKLPAIKTMRNKADKCLTPIIKARYPQCLLNASENCAIVTQVAHHHIKKSKSSALRYYLPNLIPLCHSCHMMLHANESKWTHVLIEMKGIEWARDLAEKDVLVKTDVHFYIENYNRLKELL